MARLKPSEEKNLRELAKKDPKLAEELKKHDQLSARLTDHLAQQKTQYRKNRTRELLLIGTAMSTEGEVNVPFKDGINKILSKHLTRMTDRSFMCTRGWEIDDENLV